MQEEEIKKLFSEVRKSAIDLVSNYALAGTHPLIIGAAFLSAGAAVYGLALQKESIDSSLDDAVLLMRKEAHSVNDSVRA